MKVYISADLEGIGGIITKEQITKGTSEYEEARLLLSKEVYSVIEGLVSSGVDEVYVYDAHSDGINILYDYMHPKAKYIMGYSHPDVRFPFLDSSFDFMILQGYHAMAGTERAILDHTYSSRDIYNVFLNGKKVGEIYIDALIASEIGVPIALVTGDDKVIKEAIMFMPWIKTYETKKALARYCALVIPPAVVREELKNIATDLPKYKNRLKLLDIPDNIEIKQESILTSDIDGVISESDLSRVDGRTIIKKGHSVWQTFQKR